MKKYYMVFFVLGVVIAAQGALVVGGMVTFLPMAYLLGKEIASNER